MATATGTVRTERVRGQFFLPAVITGFLALMLGLLGFEQFLNAMTLGAIYALIALGYTMVYGIIELINFAHGDVFMVATFVSIAVSTTLLGQTGAVLDIPTWIISLIVLFTVTIVVMALVGA